MVVDPPIFVALYSNWERIDCTEITGTHILHLSRPRLFFAKSHLKSKFRKFVFLNLNTLLTTLEIGAGEGGEAPLRRRGGGVGWGPLE
jgi:hypothetical protein